MCGIGMYGLILCCCGERLRQYLSVKERIEDMEFSVLLSVYKNEKPEYLQVALESIVNQTLMPNEIVIIQDGPLTSALEIVINKFKSKYPKLVRVLCFEKNRGLGPALHDGVLACKYEWIARMDTDDIAYPCRFEKQFEYLAEHPNVAMVGSWITEFSNDSAHPDTITKLPVSYDDIKTYAKRRNPFRHMTVIYKKSAVLDSGNYRDFLWFEDYDLWVRMIQKGYLLANIPEVLVNVRADDEMFARRGGWKYWKQDMKFQSFLYDFGFLSFFELKINIILRLLIRFVPVELRSFIYINFLRKRV